MYPGEEFGRRRWGRRRQGPLPPPRRGSRAGSPGACSMIEMWLPILYTTGQACSRLVYFSAVEARFWLFITSRRLSRCAEVWRKSVRGEGGSGLGGLCSRVVSWELTTDWAGSGTGEGTGACLGAAASRVTGGMGSTLTLGLVVRGALSLLPAGLPRPLLGSACGGSGSCVTSSSGGASIVSEFSGIVASTSAIFYLSRDFFNQLSR
jgi:hypothetical protein